MLAAIHDAAKRMGLVGSDSSLSFEAHYISADKWKTRKKENSAMTELVTVILLTSPMAILGGFHALRDRICAWGLFRLSPNVCIRGLPTTWPDKVFLSSHHRRTLYEIDLCVQFLVSYFYSTFKVITDLKKPCAMLDPISTYIYTDTSINHIGSDDRHWSIVNIMQDSRGSTAISLFPDRCGSQYYGDHGMVFRPGLFAASLYTGIPIIDITIVEPTESVDCTHIEFVQWQPPVVECKQTCNDAAEYKEWRRANKNIIKDFTLACEADFKRRLASMETSKASCGIGSQVCENVTKVNDRFQKAMERNLNASLHVFTE